MNMSPVSAALIGFGAVLTSVDSVVGSAVAAAGAAFEALIFYNYGRDGS